MEASSVDIIHYMDIILYMGKGLKFIGDSVSTESPFVKGKSKFPPRLVRLSKP